MLLFLLINMKKMQHENNPRRNFKVAMQKKLRENSKLLSSFRIHLNLLNEILLPGRWQKPIIKEDHKIGKI